MHRRNFIGNLLAIGAGFMILPPVAGGRIWKAEKKVIVPITDGINIWRNFYMSWEFEGLRPPPVPMPFGSVKPHDSSLWYSTQNGWCRLKKLSRPVTWETGQVYSPYGWENELRATSL